MVVEFTAHFVVLDRHGAVAVRDLFVIEDLFFFTFGPRIVHLLMVEWRWVKLLVGAQVFWLGLAGMVWVIVLDKLGDWNNAMLVPLDLFINVESLEFNQDFNHCLLHSSFRHQRLIVGSCESLFSDLDLLNRSHSVPDLLVLSSHELPTVVGPILGVAAVLENEDVSFLAVFDSIENFNAWASGVEVVMEVSDIFGGQLLELPDLQPTGDRFLEPNFIIVVQFHENDVEEVYTYQDPDREVFNLLILHESAHDP